MDEESVDFAPAYIVEETGQDNEADAHLIAAAPDLLVACIAAETYCVAMPHLVKSKLRNMLTAAIAKAEGRP